MSTSGVDYRGHGFWGNDVVIGVWMHLMERQVALVPSPEPWLLAWREDLVRLAGIMAPDFDEPLTDEHKRRVVAELARRVVASLESYGETIRLPELRELSPDSDSSHWTADLPTELFLRPARAIVKLLEGDYAPAENSTAILFPFPQ